MIIPSFENIDLEALRRFLGIETVQGIGVLFNHQCSGMLAKGLLNITVI